MAPFTETSTNANWNTSSGLLSNVTGDLNNTRMSNSLDFSNVYQNPFSILYIKVIFIILYTFVFACCFFGNLMVIVVILRHHKMRTVTNFFLGNLAVADLSVGIFCVIPNLIQNITTRWVLGRILCKSFYFFQAMSYTASVTILIVISFERYIAIIYPIKSKQFTSILLLRVVIFIVWVIAAVSGIPFLIMYDTWDIVNMQNETEITFCSLRPGLNINTKAHSLANVILGFIIPLILMTCMYTRISIVLWSSSSGVGKLTEKVGSKRSKKQPQQIFKSKIRFTAPSKEIQLHKLNMEENASFDEKAALDPSNNGIDSGDHVEKSSDFATMPSIESVKQVRWQESTESMSYMDKDSTSDNPADYEDDWPLTRGIHADGDSKTPKMNTAGSKTSYSSHNSSTGSNNTANGSKKTNSGHLKVSSGSSSTTKRKADNALVARRKVIRLLVSVIISFALCVLPYHLRMMWSSWFTTIELSFTQTLIPPITFLFYYMNSGLNPILYAFLSENFRRCLFEVITCSQRTSKRGAVRSVTYSRTTNCTVHSSYN